MTQNKNKYGTKIKAWDKKIKIPLLLFPEFVVQAFVVQHAIFLDSSNHQAEVLNPFDSVYSH